MHTEILEQLGLPKNEAKIYEALLILGKANVSVIANTAKVNRRNVYDSLKTLSNDDLSCASWDSGNNSTVPKTPKN